MRLETTGLELLDIQGHLLPSFDGSSWNQDKDMVRFSWFSTSPVNSRKDTELFTLQVKAHKAGHLRDFVNMGDLDQLRPRVVHRR